MARYREVQEQTKSAAEIGRQFSVRDPHPGWNAEDPENPFDPNIKNEFGHTHYPKWIEHPWKKETQVSMTSVNIGGGQTKQERNEHKVDKRGREFPLKVLVHSKEEEDKVMSEKDQRTTPKDDSDEKPKGWSKPK